MPRGKRRQVWLWPALASAKGFTTQSRFSSPDLGLIPYSASDLHTTCSPSASVSGSFSGSIPTANGEVESIRRTLEYATRQVH